MPLRFPCPTMAPRVVGLALASGLGLASVAFGSAAAQASQIRHDEWWLSKLSVSRAWSTSRGTGVTVAVLDTGVDPRQADLAGSVIEGPDFTRSGRASGGAYFGVHGTEMASLIAGHGHGHGHSRGIVGVAPKARILSIRVTLESGDPLRSEPSVMSALPAAIAAGIRYAASNGAQVIDLPMDPALAGAAETPGAVLPAGTLPAAGLSPAPGGAVSPGATPSPGATVSPSAPASPGASPSAGATPAADGSDAEQDAVAYALSRGVVLVAPAGDNRASGDAANYPAGYPGVIAVGAFGSHFARAPFSSGRRYVTVTAAGLGVVAAVPPSGYATVSSTSAASAVVAGVAALIKSVYPALTPAQVGQALVQSALHRPAGGLAPGFGYGTVDAARAMAAAAIAATPTARLAGADSAPRRLPDPPQASASRLSLAPRLERAGLISVAVLILLLLPVAAIAALQWRRQRSRSAAASRARPGGRRRSVAGRSGSPDRVVDYLTTPSAAGQSPGQAGYPRTGGYRRAGGYRRDAGSPGGSSRFQADPGGGWASAASPASHGPGLGSPGASGFPGERAGTWAGAEAGAGAGAGQPGAGGRPGTGSGTGSGAGASAGPGAPGVLPMRVPPTPGGRAGTARPPRVSGTPPWQPAVKPDSELPWASAPAPPAFSRAPLSPRPPAPASSAWDLPPEAPDLLAAPQPPAPGWSAPSGRSAVPDLPSTPRSAGVPRLPARPAPPGADLPGTGSTGTGFPGTSSRPSTAPRRSPSEPPPELALDAGAGDSDADSAGGPIYVWNPGAPTETFPAVPRDGA